MRNELPFDEDLVQRLPLPLAQLYRRAHNSKSAEERHSAAYYLWEAALKLLGATAVVSFLDTGQPPDDDLTGRLQNLARPSIGHWGDIVRALTVRLAETDAAFVQVRDLLLGRARDDLPRVAGLDAVLLATLKGQSGARVTVRLTELFDRLVQYRNRAFGHGAAGLAPTASYEQLGRALLAGVPQLLGRLDVLAGRRLIYLADVRRLSSGAWLVERYELIGETPRRLESLERTHEQAAALLPQQLYLAAETTLLPLHPLLGYDFDANEVLFLNARRGKQRVEYLCYTTGKCSDRIESAAQNALLARLLDMPVDEDQLRQWQEHSQAEEGPEPVVAVLRRLGEFELLSELGRGGMGVVYRAWQPSLGRQVALKSLLRVGDPKAEARFNREIAALGQVEHPHLVRIFTSGAEGERWFYAMELVEGTTLAAVCERLQERGSSAGDVDLPTWQQAVSTACEEARRAEKPVGDTAPDAAPATVPSAPSPADGPRGPLPGRSYVRHVAALVRQVAEAAHALHEKGVIHRDIKPGNVMVSPDGASATLMDLGLAQIADDVQGRLTTTRQFVGTLRYASPEQVLAVARLDRRSDVYSLGATLWELLTLRPLFGATDQTPTPELMQKIQIEEPGRVRRLNPAVPRDLAAVVEKCLQKDPKRRYATARELAGELELFLAGKPVKARPVTGVERWWKWARRRPAQAALLVLTLLTLVGLAVGGTLFAWQAEQGRLQAEDYARKEEGLRKDADEKRKAAEQEADKAGKARDFLVSIFRIKDVQAGNTTTARQILNQAEQRIPVEFADQPQLRDELLAAIADVNRSLDRTIPAAMILEARGAIQLHSPRGDRARPVPQALLYPDDRLSLAADAQVQLVLLSDLHKERLQPGREATIGRKGCSPAEAVRERDDSVLMTFVRLPKGTFYMGWDDWNQKKGVKTEIKEDFEIAVHDVTQGQWEAIMGNNPSSFSRKNNGRNSVLDISDEELKLFPVEQVSWEDVQAFLKKLNEKERGRGYWYRLPTEAEWEYACRGGATSLEECSYHFYLDKPTNDLSSAQANFNGNRPAGKAPKGPYLVRPTRVGAYPSNKLGLCDMHGNVWQWCADELGSDRVLRGGGWFYLGIFCRAAYRDGYSPSRRSNDLGFRLARVPVR